MAEPVMLSGTLSEEMWLLSVKPQDKVLAWAPKGMVTLFSSKDAVVKFASGMNVGKDKGLLQIRGWDALLALLKGLKSTGCKYVCIDPVGVAAQAGGVDAVISKVQEVVDGKFDFGGPPDPSSR